MLAHFGGCVEQFELIRIVHISIYPSIPIDEEAPTCHLLWKEVSNEENFQNKGDIRPHFRLLPLQVVWSIYRNMWSRLGNIGRQYILLVKIF